MALAQFSWLFLENPGSKMMRINQTGVLNEKKKFYRVYGRTVAPPQENIAGIPFTFLDLKKEERKQTD